ncbi:MAG TPA: protein YgfX [Gammaproteobacteria bacterium]|nr:protein YgfX [Gammaproteobacteria bacterium]
MSSQSSVNLAIEFRPSRSLGLILGGLFGLAAAGVVIADIHMTLKLVFLATLLLGGVSVFRRHILLLNPDSVVALNRIADQWTVHARDGSSRPARLEAAACWVFDSVALVFEHADSKRCHVLLTPDRVPAETLRRLRAWIRHRMPAA